MAVTGTTISQAPLANTTALLRSVCGNISAAIATAGMTQTTDTGQVNWTTITWTTGVQTWGYEVWKFSDALQSTKPFFVRLVYAQVAANLLTVTAQVGTATDGAGNLSSAAGTGVSVTVATSILANASGVTTSTSPATLSAPSYVYGDGSSIVIALWPTSGSSGTTGLGGIFYAERVRDTDGTALGDGLVVTWSAQAVTGGMTTMSTQVVLTSTTYAQPAALAGGMFFSIAAYPTFTSGVISTNMYTIPWFTGYSPRLGAPSVLVIGYYRNDMAAGNTFAVSHYGASRTFVCIPGGTGGTGAPFATGVSGSTIFAIALRTT